MYAIQNIKTGKFVYDTDRRYRPPRQLTSHKQMLTYETLGEVKSSFLYRGCGKDYRIVVLTVEVKRVIEDFPQEHSDIKPKDYFTIE